MVLPIAPVRCLLPRNAVRALSTGFTSTVPLLPDHRVHLLFGANTDVGKSIVSTGLVRAAASSRLSAVNYIKPLQCGGSDESFVLRYYNDEMRATTVNHKTLFSWETPASPHLASRWENLPVSDDEVLSSLLSTLKTSEDNTKSIASDDMRIITIIESAGGVLSPSSSSPLNKPAAKNFWGWSTQADLYSQLNIPVIFVGDGKLGGISVTLASLEALWSRGYRVDAVVFIEGADEEDYGNGSDGGNNIQFGKGNTEALIEYMTMRLHNQIPMADTTSGERKVSNLDEDSIICLPPLPPMPVPLDDWYEANQEAFMKLHALLCQRWRGNVSD